MGAHPSIQSISLDRQQGVSLVQAASRISSLSVCKQDADYSPFSMSRLLINLRYPAKLPYFSLDVSKFSRNSATGYQNTRQHLYCNLLYLMIIYNF